SDANLCDHAPFVSKYASPTALYTLSLHDALPIWCRGRRKTMAQARPNTRRAHARSSISPKRTFSISSRRTARYSSRGRESSCHRSEEHTSELQSRRDLVCRLLLEKKN